MDKNKPGNSNKKSSGMQIKISDGNHFFGNDKESLLDQMENNGVSIASACRSGACGICICNVDKGIENLEINEEQDIFDLPEGQVLACITKIKKGSTGGEIEISLI